MIDMIKSTSAPTKEDLKARAMSRLSEQGLGLAERLANLERIAYYQLDPVRWPLADRMQVDAIGDALLQVDAEYTQECTDSRTLFEVLSVEAAQTRLAIPELMLSSTATQEQVDADSAERASAQAVIDSASAEVMAVVMARSA